MKITYIAIVFALYSASLSAQDITNTTVPRSINSFSFNLMGDASVFSINFERILINQPVFFVTAKVGLGCNSEFQIFSKTSSQKYLTLPHHITGNEGKERHCFKFGFGGTVLTAPNYYLYPIVGYRLQPLRSNRFNFRIFSTIPLKGCFLFVNLEKIFTFSLLKQVWGYVSDLR